MEGSPRASFEKTLLDERSRLASRSPVRGIVALVWLGSNLAMKLLADGPEVRAILPIGVTYAAYSVGLLVMARLVSRPQLITYAVPLVDAPMVATISLVWARLPGQSADWPCGLALASCCLVIVAPARFLNTRLLAACTASAIAVVLALFVALHQSVFRTVFAVCLLGLVGLIIRMTVRQTIALVRRDWEQAEARVTAVSELNEELRRQVAERSRELTDALARSEGSVAPVALEIGDVFDGRYRVTKALGRGGMGAVYEVERTRDGKKLALKVVTAALQAKQAARFAREAEIGARLQHGNLVSIMDVGIAAGSTPFLVMELVQGGSLEDKRPRFGDAKWALPILRQIASGLAELHANSVVHRDLKPGNVLLVENGASSPLVAKISDFGISRFGAFDESGEVDVEAATVSTKARSPSPGDLTETGALMGTPLYMPPEAWFGPARVPSADVFSFGVLAYEALTGRPPFTVPPVLLARSRQPIPTPAPLDGIDVAVASLVLACMSVEPSERPRAKAIADQLGRLGAAVRP